MAKLDKITFGNYQLTAKCTICPIYCRFSTNEWLQDKILLHQDKAMIDYSEKI